MKYPRKLNVGMVSLIMGEIKGDLQAATQARNEIEEIILINFFEDAPFDAIGLIILYGRETNLLTKVWKIKKRCLDVEVTVKMEELKNRTEVDLSNIFKLILLKVLIDIAKKYNLQNIKLQKELIQLNNFVNLTN